MDQQPGLIQDKLDIKILILFILRRLPGELSPEELLELCQGAGVLGYFDYSDCLSELEESGHLTRGEEGYAITPKGAANADAVESSLPFSVRSRTEKGLRPIEERMRRQALITARHRVDEIGCTVTLAVNDGVGEILHVDLLCAGEEQARKIEKRFRKNAERSYQEILKLLTAEE